MSVITILRHAPTTYTDLIAQTRRETKEVSLDEVKRRLDAKEPYTLLDAREPRSTARATSQARSDPPRLPRDSGRGAPPGQDGEDRRVLRGRHAIRASLPGRSRSFRPRTSRRGDANPGFAMKDPRLSDETRRSSDAQRDRYCVTLPPRRSAERQAKLPREQDPAHRRWRPWPAALLPRRGRVGTPGPSTPTPSMRRTSRRQILPRHVARRHAEDRERVEKVTGRPQPGREGGRLGRPGARRQLQRGPHLSPTTTSSSTAPTTSHAPPRERRERSSANRPCTDRSSGPTGQLTTFVPDSGEEAQDPGRPPPPLPLPGAPAAASRAEPPGGRRPRHPTGCHRSPPGDGGGEARPEPRGRRLAGLLTYDSLKMKFREPAAPRSELHRVVRARPSRNKVDYGDSAPCRLTRGRAGARILYTGPALSGVGDVAPTPRRRCVS